MTIERVTTATGAMLYDATRAGKLNEQWFDPEYWSARGQVNARSGGRGGVFFVQHEDRQWVLRHYRRGGLIGNLIADRYLWTGAERTRPFREWRLLHWLHASGLNVPAPVAARFVRSGAFYRADLLTEALPATRTLAESISSAQLSDQGWRSIGSAIAGFHAVGVHHADLNAHNILLGVDATVWLLDFDRGRVRERGPWEGAVLGRLRRSLDKLKAQRARFEFGAREWGELMKGYTNGTMRDPGKI